MSENGKLNRRLKPIDALFLYGDSESGTMNVGGTLIYEGKVPFAKFRKHLDSRLHLIPRYRQRVMFPPFNVSYPTWEDDPDFDIDNHLFRVKLEKPGTEEQLQQLYGRFFTGMMDRNKPLWETLFVEGLQGDRTAMIFKMHHCMVDGVAGVGIMWAFLDLAPEGTPRTKKPPYAPRPLPNAAIRLVDGVFDSMVGNATHWLRFLGNAREFADRFDAAELRRALLKFGTTMGKFLLPLTRMPFNRTLSGERSFVWRNYSYSDVRAIRAVSGGTLNDVALTLLAGAVRKYLGEQPGNKKKYRSLRVLVPVNIRREEERNAMGNRISFLPVEVPLDIDDPLEVLYAIHQRMRELKEAQVSDSVSLMFDVVYGLPVAAQAVLAHTLANPQAQWLFGQAVDIPPANTICTNVPGPQVPLYCLGHKLTALYIVTPTVFEMGVNCSVVSYDKGLYVSVLGDVKAGGDAVQSIMRHFDQQFRSLRAACDVKGAKLNEILRAAPVDQEPAPGPQPAAPRAERPLPERKMPRPSPALPRPMRISANDWRHNS